MPTSARSGGECGALPVAADWYERLPLADGVTLLRERHVLPGVRCNIWHVRGRDRDLLVDSGMGIVALRPEIARLGGRDEILAVATHAHFDHVGGHHEFAHRLAHPAEADVLASPTDRGTVWDLYRDAQYLDALPVAGYRPEAWSLNPAPVTRLIDEGDVVDLGDRHFTVFHMPGHSPGSICLLEAATATLFTGDVVYDGELFDQLWHSDREAYRETMRRLKEIPARTFHCGHNASFGRERLVAIVDAYLARS